MYQHILISVDDSHTSGKALEKAIEICKGSAATLEIVHAVDESIFAHIRETTLIDKGAALKAVMLEGEETLAKAVKVATDAGLSPKSQLLSSNTLHAADQVAAHVAKSDADLLIVGSHGRRGIQRMLLGSVAEKLLRKVEISVLVVRHC
ncbi:universal stress protein [Cognatazoarcus halotolerans]|uniref:universal stress protein n=1 Tax=Cognatazoarcus halotolerans TaxID=2686016 RepID=UPI00135CC5A0|nr:universal stress protein [Cognatazoarcus halotolerans]MBX3679357.1 universal stress protein [Rhodocyclaceae bacterium]MCB1899834.1 universal stress protein [Rhodocyclaceae bacterium]MCP5309358.1 universal stress protein [Zoogloeaceae bacterium]